MCTIKYANREPNLIAIHLFAMTHEDFFKKDFKTADLKLSEQLEYECQLAKVISTLSLEWYMFAVVCFQQNWDKSNWKYLWGKDEKDKLPVTSNS